MKRSAAPLWVGLAAFFLVVSWAAPSAAARTSRAAIVQRLDATVAAIEQLNVPGGVIGITGDAVGRYRRAFGVAAPGVPMSLDSEFRIGSVTKTFTATVILQLVDRGRLKLGDRLSRWFPGIPFSRVITIRQLLNMTSGIWDEGGSGSLLSNWINANCVTGQPSPDCGRYWSPQQIINLATQQGPQYRPGIWSYSDTNYVLLAAIAERVTHKPYWLLLQQMVLNPLHLRHTFFPTSTLTIPTPATIGYQQTEVTDKKGRVIGFRYVPGPVTSPSTLFGAGAMISTLGDLQVWAKALGTGELLSPEAQELRMQFLPTGFIEFPLAGSGVDTGYTLTYGLGLADAGGMLGHNGVVDPPGYTAELWYLPQQHGSLVLLFNSITGCADPADPKYGGDLADVAAATLAKIAYGSSLVRTGGLPSFECTQAIAGSGVAAAARGGR
jgi:D-alanyl-D-alanine carboxypeptidase